MGDEDSQTSEPVEYRLCLGHSIKSLYMLMSFMLREAIPEIVNPDIQDDIRRMVDYIVYIHGPYFLKARLATATPRLDLNR